MNNVKIVQHLLCLICFEKQWANWPMKSCFLALGWYLFRILVPKMKSFHTFDSNTKEMTFFFSRIWIITRQPFSLNVGHSKKFGSFIVSKLLKHNHETCALRFRWNDVRVVWSKTFSNSIMWKDYLLFFESQRWPWMNHVPTSCWLWLTFHKLPTHLLSST